jgi:hypothetical protein
MTPLILNRASASRSSGQRRDDDYDVLENRVVVGRIFCLDVVGPQGRRWMWASRHNGDIKRAAHGYEATCEAAMGRSRSRGGGVDPAWGCTILSHAANQNGETQ